MIDLGILKIGVTADNAEANKNLEKTKQVVEELDEQYVKTEKQIGKLQKAKSSLNDNVSKVKNGFSNLALGAGALTATVIGLQEATEEYRTDLSKLETNANMAGLSFDNIKESFINLSAVTGETDSTIEGLSNLMQSGFDNNQMQTVIDELTGAVVAFPDTLKFESLADGLQETIATGVGVGQFSELLERSGISLDTFNAKMAECSTEAQKQDIALKYLAKTGMKEVGDAYKTNNKDLLDNKKAQLEFQDTIANLVEKILPMITSITQVVTDFVNFLINNQDIVIPIIASIGAMFLTWNVASMIQGIIGAIKALTTTQWELNIAMSSNPIGIIITLVAGLVVAFIALWNKCEGFRNFWIGLWDGIKSVISAVVDFFKNLFTETIPNLFKSFVDFLYNTFVKKWVDIWGNVKDVFKSVFDSLVDIVKTPLNLILGLVNGLIDGINFIIKGINKIKIDIPDWDWLPDNIQGKSLGFNIDEIKHIKYFAEGGILTQATTFGFMGNTQLVGGEAGAEAIIPLDKLPDLMAKMQGKRQNKIGDTYNVSINVKDIKEFNDIVRMSQNQKQFGRAY